MNRAFKAAIQAPGAVGEGEGLGRNFLDCMWAHLPWFAIVMALAIVAIVLTVFTAVLVINPGVVLFTQAFLFFLSAGSGVLLHYRAASVLSLVLEAEREAAGVASDGGFGHCKFPSSSRTRNSKPTNGTSRMSGTKRLTNRAMR